MKTATTALAALTLVGVTMPTGISAASGATIGVATARAVNGGPSDQRMMDSFRDEWGQTTVEPTGITNWQTLSMWDRAAQYAFAPGTNETTSTPKQETDLAPLHLDIVTRQAHHKTEYQVRETADGPGGTPILNYFPVFSGTPRAMTFYNAAGLPGLPTGEIQQNCRNITSSDRHFLTCRMIVPDGSIHYQIKVPSGSPTDDLPSIDTVMHAFRTQWGTATFTPTGVTPWRPISQWQRFDGLDFNEGDNETDGTPVDWETSPLNVPFTLWLMTRTVNGEQQFAERGLAIVGPGVAREDGFAFGRFSGNPTDWFIQSDGHPSAGGEYRQHRKVVTIDGRRLVVDRTLVPQPDGGHSITYYVLRPTR